MSLQWTLIAGFLYVEVAIVLMLVLPVASPTRWQKLFRSRFLQSLSSRASIYFVVLLGVLVLFLLDAIREMRKYSSSLQQTDHHQHLNLEMQGKLFNVEEYLLFCTHSPIDITLLSITIIVSANTFLDISQRTCDYSVHRETSTYLALRCFSV